jgi:serine phosphatase RsbU (regulator of sigma subunit)
MMESLKNSWKKVLTFGLKPEQSFSEQKKIRLTNSFAFLVSLVGSFFELVSLILNDTLSNHFVNLLTISIGLLTLSLNRAAHYETAKILSLVFFSFYMASFVWIFGILGNGEVYLISIAVGALLLFDKKRFQIPLFTLAASAYIFTRLFMYDYIGLLDKLLVYHYLNFAFGFLLFYLILQFFKNEHLTYERTIEEKNKILSQQKVLIERKNKQITDSINYASRIQQAILPQNEVFDAFLPKNLIFYLPKDIVSGDFYWLESLHHKTDYLFLAVADCTGHGVSGCLMSMIGVNNLTQIVSEMNIHSPAQILNELDRRVRLLLKQDGHKQELNDGMDIALLRLDFRNNTLLFSAAKRPLWLIREGQLIEIKGDKFPIGSGHYSEKSFTEHSLALEDKDRLYLFSDGIVDQFDAADSKRFGSKQLRNLILSIQNQELSRQKESLRHAINQWSGPTRQTDDILLIALER